MSESQRLTDTRRNLNVASLLLAAPSVSRSDVELRMVGSTS